jgi:biotin synthase-like enzyme
LGNYLTTQGEEVHTDLAMLKQLGLEIALTP